jgi:MYXO-CTERM domain-containing protein
MSLGRRAIAPLAVVGSIAVAAAAPAAAQTVSPQGTQPGGLAGATAPADVANMCRSCHTGGIDDDGKAFRPWETWAGTMMANATRDPLFLAALSVSEQDAPGSGAYCLRCHTPKGFVKGNATGRGGALDADDQQGVDCEACHRSIDASVAQPGVMHDGAMVAGFAALDAQAPYIGNARLHWDPRDVRHGPYDDADSPAHAAAGDRFTSSSELCGQCHEVLSPLRNLLNAALIDTGFPFPLDNTYTEWASSDYARPGTMKSCVDCHMPAARGDALTVSTFPSSLPRANPRMHMFVGGNEWGLEAVKLANPSLATEREAAFTAAAEAVRAMLATAVRIDVTPGPAQAGATTFDVQVRVTNLSGHKFPTGYADGRRAFLQVELQDAQGRSLGLLGRYDAAEARLDHASELRVWESIQAEHLAGGGHREWHIAKNDTIVKDTRIPPAGFRPTGAAAIAMTSPVGADYGPVTGMRNYDDVAVHFASLEPLPAGTLRVTARVFYQSTMREFVEELARANTTDDRGTKLLDIWEQTGKAAPRLIATASADVTPGAPIVGDGGSDGPAASGGSGCGCSLPGDPLGGPAGLLLLLLVVARRRRR